jgi:hemoglobin-like flavoprotein
MIFNVTKENSVERWDVDIRGGTTPPKRMAATYERSLGEMIQDLNQFHEDFDASNMSYDIAVWALFEAIGEVLGDSRDAKQITKLAASITAFMDKQLESGVIEAETYDERSAPTA